METKNHLEERQESPTYCSYFWKHICVRPDFLVKPCCRFDMNGHWPLRLTEQVDPVINSELYKTFRKKALLGEPIAGCKKCYQQEKSSGHSLRTTTNAKYKESRKLTETVSPNDIEFLELFMGDTCNLKCVTCRPQLSTKWREDFKALGWPLDKRSEKINLVKAIEGFMSLNEIKLVGGEPLLDPQHLPLLRSLVEKGPEKIKLTYFTNNTVFPKPEVLNLWSEFKGIEIFFSVDGIGEINDYIRFPSKWQQVEQVIDGFLKWASTQENASLQVATTVSVLNIWSLGDIEDWYQNKKAKFKLAPLKRLIFNPLMEPEFLSISNLPESQFESLKAQLLNSTKRQQKIGCWMEKGKRQEFNSHLIAYLNDLDKVRNVNFRKIVPQLSIF